MSIGHRLSQEGPPPGVTIGGKRQALICRLASACRLADRCEHGKAHEQVKSCLDPITCYDYQDPCRVWCVPCK